MCQACDDAIAARNQAIRPTFSYNCSCCLKEHKVDSSWARLSAFADYGKSVMINPETGELTEVQYLCRECYDLYYSFETKVKCPCCRAEKPIRQMNLFSFEITAGNNICCDYCAANRTFWCDGCDERMLRTDIESYQAHNGSRVCESCFSDNYFTCDICEGIFHNEDCSDEEDECVCKNCYNGSNRLIHEYSFRPMPNFFGLRRESDKSKKIFYGCELEVSVHDSYSVDSKARTVVDLLNKNGENHVYLKRDSSIGRGFEIVTHPHSWDEISKLWLENWEEKIAGISSHNAGTCGFHVHVSRKPLTNMHIQKMVVFVNAAENANLIKTVAQRECNEWGKLDASKKIGYCRYSDERYEAINLVNRNTIEFRIFRGNVRKDRIMKNLEFVKATIDFTRDRSYRDLSTNSFVKFVQQHRKEYKHLCDYLNTAKFYPNPSYSGSTATDC